MCFVLRFIEIDLVVFNMKVDIKIFNRCKGGGKVKKGFECKIINF